MCLIKDAEKILVQERTKKDWPGLTLPGGKVKDDETIFESVKREIKEETGLDISDVKERGYIEWNIEDKRHLCILFESSKFKGDLRSSSEGEVWFLDKSKIKEYRLSEDLDKILDIYGIEWR